MPGNRIKEFLVALGFEIDEAGYQKFNRSLASASLRAAAFGAGIQAAAAGAYALLYKIAQGQSQMLSLSEATGVAVGRMEELGYVAEQTGSSQEALTSSLVGLQQAMAGATIGQGGLAAFQRLGIRIKDANGKLRDTSDVLFEVGQRLQGMDQGRQLMFLNQLGIDRSLVKMLTTDVSGLTAAYQEMYAAAGTDAQKAAEASRAFVNEVGSIKTVLWMLAKSVGFAVIGKMQADLVRLRKSIIENFRKITQVIQIVVAVLMRVAGAFGALTMRLMQWIGGIVEWFGKLDTGTQNLILAALGFAAAWRFLNLSFLATPLGMLIAGLAAIVALVDDFQTYMEGGDSLIDWGPWAGQIMEVVDALRPLMDALGQLWDMFKGPLIEGVKLWASDMASTLGSLLGAVASFITAIVRLFQGDFAGALEAFIGVFERLGEIVMRIAGRIGDVIASSWGAVKSLFGGGDNPERPSSPVLGPAPALAAASAGNASNVDLQANTTIYVDGARDPAAVGRAVGGEQGRVNADLVRHTKGAAR